MGPIPREHDISHSDLEMVCDAAVIRVVLAQVVHVADIASILAFVGRENNQGPSAVLTTHWQSSSV
jgi:hypothetical protein